MKTQSRKDSMKSLFVALSFGFIAAAQAQSLPGDAAVDAQRQKMLDAMAATANFGAPGTTAPASVNRPNLGGIDAFNKAANDQAKPSDFMNLSRNGAIPQTKNTAKKNSSDLIIFASMSMPEKMLIDYAVQAKRFGAVILLRGFIDDKASRTREVLARLNQAGAEFEINPEPFKHFKITKVPTVVLASADAGSIIENGCARPDTYVSISGNITLLDALDKFSLLSKTGLASDAKSRIVLDRQSGKRG